MKAAQTKNTMDDQLVPIIRKSLRVFVVTFGTLAILQSLNISILPLLTGLSIGGLAFALAAQDTIKNFFGLRPMELMGPSKKWDLGLQELEPFQIRW